MEVARRGSLRQDTKHIEAELPEFLASLMELALNLFLSVGFVIGSFYFLIGESTQVSEKRDAN